MPEYWRRSSSTRSDNPLRVDANEVHSGISIGIAVSEPETDAETLLSHADVALYRAKSEGRQTFRFFNDAMDQEVRSRVNLLTELRWAIANEQFFLVYQPQVDLHLRPYHRPGGTG